MESPFSSPLSTREIAEADRLIAVGWEEDLRPTGDITTAAVLPPDATGQAVMRVRHDGMLAGGPVLDRLARHVGPGLHIDILYPDGPVAGETVIARWSGRLAAILAAERLGLNIVSRLSGVATLTRRYVDAIAGTGAVICDTRKTTPGMRLLEKYAVRVGGGVNHRLGLYDEVLIKDNHLAALTQAAHPLLSALQSAREKTHTRVTVEVDSVAQMQQLLTAAQSAGVLPDCVLLDNFTLAMLEEAVGWCRAHCPSVALEASGGVNLNSVAAIARTGVQRISVGALTHSAPCLDIGLDYEPVAVG